MSATDEKEFVLKHVFTDVMSMKLNEFYRGKKENHFNVPWQVAVYRTEEKRFLIYLVCFTKRRGGDKNASIETETEIKLIPATGETLCQTRKYCYGISTDFFSFTSADLEKCLVDGKLDVEMHVKIIKMNGIEKEKLRNFDESTKQFSDVVLSVAGEKFYVMKLYLASHSSYFNSLLFGNFDESKQSEIALSGINKWDFQNFLELIHGESAIDEDTIDGILHLADMYGSNTAVRRCEEFLLKYSTRTLKENFDVAIKHKMDKLRKKCISEIKTKKEVISLAPTDAPNQMNPDVWAELFKKVISF